MADILLPEHDGRLFACINNEDHEGAHGFAASTVHAHAAAVSAADNARLREALGAMLTHMGMDEDEWNKPTFDQARKALSNE